MAPVGRHDPQATRPPARRLVPLNRDPVTRPLVSITAASTKADIIDAALELTETQAETIADLRERQLVLWALVGVLSVLLVLGA